MTLFITSLLLSSNVYATLDTNTKSSDSQVENVILDNNKSNNSSSTQSTANITNQTNSQQNTSSTSTSNTSTTGTQNTTVTQAENQQNTQNTENIQEVKKYDVLKNVENSTKVVRLASQSKEELQSLYDRGFRVFEITVSSTLDRQLVLADNFSQYFIKYYGKSINKPTIDEYFANKMLNGNTPMSLGDINMFLDKYPDSRFMIRTLDSNNAPMEMIKNMPFKNKDKLIVETADSLASFKELNTVAIVDIKGKGGIESYIARNKEKKIFFIYENTLPSAEEIEVITKSGNVVYELKKQSNNTNITGYIYPIEEAINLNINIPQPVSPKVYQRPSILNDRFIAHAGGEYSGLLLTNALQTMKSSYARGNRLIEIDFEWTNDGKAVQVHDWATFNKLTNSDVTLNGYYMNYDEFKQRKMIYLLQQMSIDDTAQFMKQHGDAYIVTDVKEDNMKDGNIKMLSEFAQDYPELTSRIIPQIYNTAEYQKIRNLGYNHVIYTLYRTEQTTYNVLEFVKSNDLYAVTMDNSYRIYSNLPILLQNMGERVYTHTENDKARAKNFILSGRAYGIYSDNILSDTELNS